MVTNVPLWFQILIVGEVVYVEREDGVYDNSVLSAQFYCDQPKLLLKIKFIKNYELTSEFSHQTFICISSEKHMFT